MQAARLILADTLTLYNELAICKGFSPEMLELAASVKQSADKRELYRRVLGHIKNRLVATIKWCETELIGARASETAAELCLTLGGRRREYLQTAAPSGGLDVIEPIFDAAELTTILTTMHSSLVHGGYADVADGHLVDLIRRVATFGLTLVPLDLRQESTRHMMAVNALTEYLGDYSSHINANTNTNTAKKLLRLFLTYMHGRDRGIDSVFEPIKSQNNCSSVFVHHL